MLVTAFVIGLTCGRGVLVSMNDVGIGVDDLRVTIIIGWLVGIMKRVDVGGSGKDGIR